MSPQPRGEVPLEHAARIRRAVKKLAESQDERDQAIADALKAGGSTRMVGAIAGLGPSQVGAIGRARGWPTPEQQKADAERKAANAAWREFVSPPEGDAGK